MTRSGECHQRGECCKTVNITAVRDSAIQQHGSREELEKYLGYRGIKVAGARNWGLIMNVLCMTVRKNL